MNKAQFGDGFFRPRRIGHINFWANNAESVAEFYQSVVGIEVVYRRPALRGVFMSNGSTYHDVAFMDLDSPRGAGHKPGLHHFSLELECERDLVEGFKQAREAGFEFDTTISADVTNSCYGFDPDGNRFEVYADVKPNWREERHGDVSSGSKKWIPGESEPLTTPLYPIDPEIVVLEDALFHPRRVSHVVLVARNYPAMVRHYIEVAGLSPLAGGLAEDFVILGGALGEETLSIFRSQGVRTPGLHHFGLELPNEEELVAAKSRLAALGKEPEFEIDHPTRRSLYLRDPNGQLIQFYVDRQRDYGLWPGLPIDVALFVA